MENYAHITRMEEIMVREEQMLKELGQLLTQIDAHRAEYQDLITYYCSEQRMHDLDDDAAHRIPETMCRGVLSEDEIFDLIGDRRDTAIRMLETATHMLKD